MSDALMQPYCAVLLPFRAHFLSPYLRKNFKKKEATRPFYGPIASSVYSVVSALTGSFEWRTSTCCKADIDLFDALFVILRQNHLIDSILLIVEIQRDSAHPQ